MYESESKQDTYGEFYSEHYSDTEWRESMAVQALVSGVRSYDWIESVDYKVEYPVNSGNKVTVLTHQRWQEYFGYEPE